MKRKKAAFVQEEEEEEDYEVDNVEASPARVNTNFLARMVTSVKSGNQRVLDTHATNAANLVS